MPYVDFGYDDPRVHNTGRLRIFRCGTPWRADGPRWRRGAVLSLRRGADAQDGGRERGREQRRDQLVVSIHQAPRGVGGSP